MRFSYIAFRKKSLFFEDTKVWLLFFVVTTLILSGFYFVLHLQITLAKDELDASQSRIVRLNKEIDNTAKRNKTIRYKYAFATKIFSKNVVFKESTKNLFDLIPRRITLTKVVMQDNMLKLIGLTPTKDIYNYLLEIPLRSIFEESRVRFYVQSNGWYSFTSVNYFESTKR